MLEVKREEAHRTNLHVHTPNENRVALPFSADIEWWDDSSPRLRNLYKIAPSTEHLPLLPDLKGKYLHELEPIVDFLVEIVAQMKTRGGAVDNRPH